MEEVQLDYDPLSPFVVCAGSYTPIYRGQPVEHCSFCRASFKPTFKGKVCAVCNVGAVGGAASGLRRLEMPGRAY